MPNGKKYFLSAVVAALAFVFFSLGIVRQCTYGQTTDSDSGGSATSSQRLNVAAISSPPSEQQSLETAPTPQTEASKNLLVKTAAVLPVIPATATTDNIRFRDSLNWTFGGKPQRGWYLYVDLIKQTIGTSADPSTTDFAQSVAIWQQKNNLAPTGSIDRDTLFRFVAFWQAQRLNSSAYPSSEQLLTAPITDFYDPARPLEMTKVERETYAAYKRMVAAAARELNLKTTETGELAPDEKFLKIVSAFRSREYQAKLRAADPNSGRAGLATNSPHFTGNALDIYVGGEPVITKDFNRAIQVQTPAYKWLVKNAARFGFYPYYYEPWHWEYVPRNLKKETFEVAK